MMRSLIFLLASFTVCSGYWWDVFGWSYEKWDALEVRWNLTDPRVKLPTTAAAAIAAGWVKISDCDPNSPFSGVRYKNNSDSAIILIFDKNGEIAGIQCSLPDNQPNGYPGQVQRPPFIREGNRYIVTAYFTDPTTICTTGRTPDQVADEGTGSNLYIQNGSTPDKSITLPRLEANMAGTKWNKGKCFPTMGRHYWWNLYKDMDCGTIFPVFGLYNDDQLDAFGFAFPTDLSSPIYEQPSAKSFQLFMEEVPTCLQTRNDVHTLHVYLSKSVNLC